MFEGDDIGEVNDPDSDYQIDSIDNGDDLTLAYGLYAKLNTYLNHYNSIKTKYKQRALAWLIATFVGYGYILSGKEGNLPIDNLLGVALMSCFSAAGILSLAFLDLSVYHRFVEGIFNQTKKLEKKFPILSNTNHVIDKLLTQEKIGPSLYDGLLYVAFTSVVLVIGALSYYQFLTRHEIPYSVLILTLSFAMIALIEFFVLKSAIQSGEHQLFIRKKR